MPLLKKIVLWTLRILVGGVFVVSGITKMLDLWGFVFKIEEYLAIWHLMQPRTVVFMAAMAVSGYEFVLGALMAMGCYKRVAPWGLLLTMAVMLPLTCYLWIANPVSDCGCFGDFLVLSNGATFAKNIFLTAALIYLACESHKLHESLFNPAIQWMVGAWISLYIIIIGLYGYNAQPMVDFRGFHIGTMLAAEEADDEGGGEYEFLYRKDGVTEHFTIDNLPDSTWEFVDRVEVASPAAANALATTSAPHREFAVFDDGDDVTAEVIGGEGRELLLVIPEPRRADVSYTYTINEIYEYADSLGMRFVALLGTDSAGIARWKDVAMADYPCYSVDDTQLKELSRGLLSIVILEDGKIVSKTTLSSMNPDSVENPGSEEVFMKELTGYGARWFSALNWIFGCALLLLYLFQGLILAIRIKIKNVYRKKHAKIS